MKKTYLKSIWRTIRHSLSRFLAIFSIVALGSGFLAGVLASPLDMRLSADNYCDQGNMFDLREKGIFLLANLFSAPNKNRPCQRQFQLICLQYISQDITSIKRGFAYRYTGWLPPSLTSYTSPSNLVRKQEPACITYRSRFRSCSFAYVSDATNPLLFTSR